MPHYFFSQNEMEKDFQIWKSKVYLFMSGFKSNPNSREFDYAHSASKGC